MKKIINIIEDLVILASVLFIIVFLNNADFRQRIIDNIPYRIGVEVEETKNGIKVNSIMVEEIQTGNITTWDNVSIITWD